MALFRVGRRKNQTEPESGVRLFASLLRVHQSVLLEVGVNRYPCRVYDYDRDTITLTAPLDGDGHPVFIEPDTRVRVIVQTADGFFGGNTKVVAPRIIEDTPLLVIGVPETAGRTDRRAYYRVPVDLPIEYETEGAFTAARMVDLSGGGALISVPAAVQMELNSKLTLRFSLPTTEDQLVLQAIVRKVSEPNPRASQRRVACEFVNVPTQTREAIVRYVAKRQLELIRAGFLQR